MPEKPPLGPPGALAPFDWFAIKNYDAWDDPYSPDEAVAAHHGGGGRYPAGTAPFTQAKEIAQLQAWERYHLNADPSRGKKPWRGLAYGWGIGQTGTIYRARGWNHYAAHAGDVDADHISNNAEIIPLLFILDGVHQHPSEAALGSFEFLRGWIERQTGNTGMRAFGHGEISTSGTTCPGPNVQTYIEAHRYTTTLPPPPAGDWTEEIIMSLPTLAKGDGFNSEGKAATRPDVKTAQGLLLARGHKDQNTASPEDATDGWFGTGTKTSTMAFQSDVGLFPDGVIGEKTWTKLLLQ